MHKVYFFGPYCVIILSIHYATTSELDTVGLRVSIWKINFFSSVLWLSEVPRCKERPQTVICCLE